MRQALQLAERSVMRVKNVSARWPNQILRTFQLPVQTLKRVAEIILLFGNQCRVSEAVNGSYEAAHHRVSSSDRALQSRLRTRGKCGHPYELRRPAGTSSFFPRRAINFFSRVILKTRRRFPKTASGLPDRTQDLPAGDLRSKP
jgi:hypothetical protein